MNTCHHCGMVIFPQKNNLPKTMNQNYKDILRMAKQSFREWNFNEKPLEWLVHFAGLVAEREREACAKICVHAHHETLFRTIEAKLRERNT